MSKVFIIAEAGVNHNGSLALAKKLIRAAAKAGADAVKFQTFSAKNLVTQTTPQADYQRTNLGRRESQFAMLKKLELTPASHRVLADYARTCGIQFMSTPFDDVSLDFLTANFTMPYLKLSSGEITNAPFLLKSAQKRMPIILSTGMSRLEEIREALSVLSFGLSQSAQCKPGMSAFRRAYQSRIGRQALRNKVTLLHCVSEYPAPKDQVHLKAIPFLAKEFNVAVGFSDHTLGIHAAIAATAMGAQIIEKHLTLSRKLHGVDHRASLEPHEFEQMVQGIRDVEVMLGKAIKSVQPSEKKNIAVARRRLVAKEAIQKNDYFSEENLIAKRSLKGRPPRDFWALIGSRAKRHYKKDEAIL